MGSKGLSAIQITNIFVFLTILIFPISLRADSGETLTVSYIQHPPYYFTEKGRASGFLIELSRKIFKDAGVRVSFSELPPKRIMQAIRKNDRPHCSVGWFRNPGRERFARFSRPIYQDKPFKALASQAQKHLFSPHSTLRSMFSDKSLTMGMIRGFSYGSAVDALIAEMSPGHRLFNEQTDTVMALSLGGISYVLIAPEEKDMLIRSAGLNPADFTSFRLPDIPFGNKRHLMFAKNTDQALINRINASVSKFVGLE